MKIIPPFFVFISSALYSYYLFAQSFYSLSRLYIDTKKDSSFEDIFEFKQRFFIEERFSLANEKMFINLSGKLDLNYFQGGFSRFSPSFDLFEFYVGTFVGNFSISAGRKIVSWGIVDNSPSDVVNRPNFSEGFFNEPKFLKTPSIVAQVIWFSGNSSINFVYEPFFTPPVFSDVGGDWAIMNWNSLYEAFEGDKENPQLENILNGLISPIVKEYPEKLTEMFMSFGLGAEFKTSFENLRLMFVSYTGSSIFPVPFFDQTFVDYFERSPQPLSEKFNISALEIVEPASRGESFIKLEPKRYYLVGGGWSYDIRGYLLKNEITFYLLNDLPDENLRIREFNILSWAFDVEREVIPDLFIIPSFRGMVNLSPNKIMLIEDGVFLPSLSARYEFFIGNQSVSFLANGILDVPLGFDKIRSRFFLLSATYKPYDTLEVSFYSFIFGGEDISLFGFFRENSALSFWVRFYL